MKFSIRTIPVIIVVNSSFVLILTSVLGQTDWPTYGRDPGGQRYSALTQINPGNVTKLVRVWTYHMKPASAAARAGETNPSPRGRRRGAPESEATPLVVGGVMYLTTAYNRVVALEPETGNPIWQYEVKGDSPATRGLEYWGGGGQASPRLFFGTTEGRLIALDARTGQPVQEFGKGGEVNMKAGVMNSYDDAFYGLSSPPSMYKNLVITGAHTQETPSLGASGDVRAWDAITGKMVWEFHTVPRPGESGHDTWEGDSWKARSGTNVWGMMTVDTERGLVFLPLGSPTYDYYGGDRKGANLFANCLVALEAGTGKLKWYFQMVHHDLWDYDLSTPPVLLDVVQRGTKIPAVAVMTKMGLLFILDRRNGKPVFGVEERPVPPTDVPGEGGWATQPFPIKPAPLARNSFKREELAMLIPDHRKFCETYSTKMAACTMKGLTRTTLPNHQSYFLAR